jgi:hypothetical protein
MGTNLVLGLFAATLVTACGGGERSAAEFCVEFATKRCDRLQECLGPQGLEQNGLPLTKEECVAQVRQLLHCDGLTDEEACPSGGIFDSEQAGDCVSQVDSASCSAFADVTFGVEACRHVCTDDAGPSGDDDDDTAGAVDASTGPVGSFYITWDIVDANKDYPLSCYDIGATEVSLTTWPANGVRIKDTFDCSDHEGASRLLPQTTYGYEVRILSGEVTIGSVSHTAELDQPIVDLGNIVWTY